MDAEISPAEVDRLLDEGDDAPVVVDIRSPTAFARGHIPGSRNIPFEEIPSRVQELTGEDRIVTVCPHGESSVQAARLIKSYEGTSDARVESMAGGLTEWSGELARDESTDGSDENRDEDAPF
jgi:rhodanese-related sulfurtransferase